MKLLSRVLRLVTAGILIQTLFFKFTGAAESRWIFGTLGVEPWGRWFAGISELIAAGLLLIPAFKTVGALVAIGIMMVAILSHVFILGIVVQGDGGLLFLLAWMVMICSLGIFFMHFREFKKVVNRWAQKRCTRIS